MSKYKIAFVLAHKLRKAMAAAAKALRIGGDGRTTKVGGAYFRGHLRPKNLALIASPGGLPRTSRANVRSLW